ncbi:MAG: DUF2867 domain-containing protein [Chloroflexi bacterium SZAS-1]|jgi:hypothetical protein|nr:DUF2867 domain-containing protein [Chloroflexi bacterium SZAS-1]HNP86376.1 DUF2867 domain-containing protein [Kouleothrix sp.]
MNSAVVQPVALPTGTLIEEAFVQPDYADAYRARLPAGAPTHIGVLVSAAFGSVPGWVQRLMTLRNWLVQPLGLKISLPSPMVFDLRPGGQLGIFKVYARSDDEVLLGEDDHHLDFRVSLLRVPEQGSDWIVVSTVVRFNNWLGRLYFLPVQFFHRLIVVAMLRRGLLLFSECS